MVKIETKDIYDYLSAFVIDSNQYFSFTLKEDNDDSEFLMELINTTWENLDLKEIKTNLEKMLRMYTVQKLALFGPTQKKLTDLTFEELLVEFDDKMKEHQINSNEVFDDYINCILLTIGLYQGEPIKKDKKCQLVDAHRLGLNIDEDTGQWCDFIIGDEVKPIEATVVLFDRFVSYYNYEKPRLKTLKREGNK